MDIRNSLESLRSILGPSSATTPAAGPRTSTTRGTSTLGADQATLSCAGSEVSLTANADGVRMDKVASIQAALAAGTYNVPTEAVASRMVDAMLGGGN